MIQENSLAIIEKDKVIIKPDGVSLFSDQVHYWVNFFGLTDWCVLVVDENEPGQENPVAKLNTNCQGRSATITFYTEWLTDVYSLELAEEQIRSTAYHEAVHLVLADLRDLANSRQFSFDEYYKAEESAVRRFENSFYKFWKERT